MTENELRNLLGENLPELDKMINSTPSCLKIITKDGKLLNMNPQGLSLIEAPDMDSVFGANVYDIVEESHREKFMKFNEKVCNGESGHLIFEIIGLEGTRRWMETYAAPYTLSNGDTAHIAITNDISNKITSDETILLQKQALEESARLATLGQFVSGIAHEVNNPIAIIAAKAAQSKKQIQNNNFNTEDIIDSLEKIEKTAFRVSKIIMGLKSFSRDPAKDDKSVYLFKDIISDTLELCTEKFRLHNIELDINIDENLKIFCKNVQISQVLMNLLNNSYDAIDGLENKWIKINTEIIDHWVDITFTDSGEGISEEVSQYMLNPFFTTKDVGQGTGLGLSICVGIIKDHGGFFNYNKKSKNTQFVIRLPRYLEEPK